MKNRIGKRSPMRRLRKTRAIEPVIAALLLIAIAVAAAVVTYSWVMGMISSQQAQAGTGIRIDLVEFKVDTDISDNTLTTTATLKTDLIVGAISTLKKSDITGADYTKILSGSIIKAGSRGTLSLLQGSNSTELKFYASNISDYTLTNNYYIPGGSWDFTLASGSTVKVGSTIKTGSSVPSDRIEITIRNSGSVIGIIATIYVRTPEGDQWKQDWTSSNVITPAQTKKFVFTTLNTVTGSTGAAVGDLPDVPFGWVTSSSYTIRIITDNGFVSELAQTSPSTHA